MGCVFGRPMRQRDYLHTREKLADCLALVAAYFCARPCGQRRLGGVSVFAAKGTDKDEIGAPALFENK